jgi:hypothetical protein
MNYKDRIRNDSLVNAATREQHRGSTSYSYEAFGTNT